MKGKIFAVGIGPGDPELITIKAINVIKNSHTIFVPKGREEGSSIALSIVKEVVDLKGKQIVEVFFPMVKTKYEEYKKEKAWNEIVESVYERLNRGENVSFLTLGDPTLYSTFFYIHRKLIERDKNIEIHLIPGVSSITACAAVSQSFLAVGNEKIAILPANYIDSYDEIFDQFETIVLMKVHVVFEKILEFLRRRNLIERSVYITRAGMEGERVIRDIENVTVDDKNYFSIIIVKK